jgi:predicted nucleotidyltransferase
MRPGVSAVLADVCRWARSRSDIRGLALVGSHASGKARDDSDVDLVIVADTPGAYQNADWLQSAVGQRAIVATCGQPFGNVWSLFVTLAEGPEIEFTFAERSWVKTDPLAPEVCRIVRDGVAILFDPLGELLALCKACGVASMGQTRRYDPMTPTDLTP